MASLHVVAQPSRRSARRLRNLTHQSTLREKAFEHVFLGQLGIELIERGVRYDVLRGEVDLFGHDIVIETGSVARHIQLKVMIDGGARADVTVSTELLMKPSACVIWLTWSPDLRDFSAIRWFGNAPGEPIPSLGDRKAKHSRANVEGIKSERPAHRVLTASLFRKVEDIAQLADLLFGMQPQTPADFLLSRMRSDMVGPDWVDALREGELEAIPTDLGWEGSISLADLIDGYRMAALSGIDDVAAFLEQQREQARADGVWRGDAITLWTTLFLEHRAWYFADGFGPDREHTVLLDRLVGQLRAALAGLA